MAQQDARAAVWESKDWSIFNDYPMAKEQASEAINDWTTRVQAKSKSVSKEEVDRAYNMCKVIMSMAKAQESKRIGTLEAKVAMLAECFNTVGGRAKLAVARAQGEESSQGGQPAVAARACDESASESKQSETRPETEVSAAAAETPAAKRARQAEETQTHGQESPNEANARAPEEWMNNYLERAKANEALRVEVGVLRARTHQTQPAIVVNAAALHIDRVLTHDQCVKDLKPFTLAVLEAKVGGERIKALIDPGAQMSLVDEKTAEQLRATEADSVTIEGLPDTYKLEAGTWGAESHRIKTLLRAPITLLGERQTCVLLVVPDLSPPVLLGLDSLNKLATTVDAQQQTVACNKTHETVSYAQTNDHMTVRQSVVVAAGQPCERWQLTYEDDDPLTFRKECPTAFRLRTVTGQPCSYTGPILIETGTEPRAVGVALHTAIAYANGGWVCVAIPHLGEDILPVRGALFGSAVPFDSEEYEITNLADQKNGPAQRS